MLVETGRVGCAMGRLVCRARDTDPMISPLLALLFPKIPDARDLRPLLTDHVSLYQRLPELEAAGQL